MFSYPPLNNTSVLSQSGYSQVTSEAHGCVGSSVYTLLYNVAIHRVNHLVDVDGSEDAMRGLLTQSHQPANKPDDFPTGQISQS